MKRVRLALFVWLVSLTTSIAAGGELRVTIANFSNYEIQSIAVASDTSAMRDDILIVPGNRSEMTLDGASQLREMAVDTGMMHFTFPDMSPVAEYSALTLELSLDADLVPRLTLDETSVGGPIDGFHIWIDVAGAMTFHLPPDTDANAVPLPDLLSAGSMAAVRAMGARDSPVEENQLLLPVSFAETTWAALVNADDASSGDEAMAQPGPISLRAWRTDSLDDVVDALTRMNFRPCYLRITEGADMEAVKTVTMLTENVRAEEAATKVKAECESVDKGYSPKAMEAIFVSDAAYADAVAGGREDTPAFRLRVTNASDMTLTYSPKGSVPSSK